MELGISPLPGGGGQGAEEVRCVVLLLLSETLTSLAGRFNGDYEDKMETKTMMLMEVDDDDYDDDDVVQVSLLAVVFGLEIFLLE
jgi:hypothetical protein